MDTITTIDPGSKGKFSSATAEIQAVFERASAYAMQADRTILTAEDLEKLEADAEGLGKSLAQAIMAALLQKAVSAPELVEAATDLVRSQPRKLRSDGVQTVNIRTARGTVIPVETRYYREKGKGGERRPGLYPVLALLGIWDHCTPTLASKVSKSVTMLSSLEEARTQLSEDGINLDVKTIRSIAYRYAGRARAARQAERFNLGEGVAGKRAVISLDGGRARVRRNKRGRKTPKGRPRLHTDWQEPKLLIIYVVGEDGRPSRTWAPVIDGTLQGPDAIFALLLSYTRHLGLGAADKVLFVADGAPWIWTRVAQLIRVLGLRPAQVVMLIDFYHAAKHLSDAVKLRRWNAKRQRHWLTRNCRLLRRGEVDQVIAALDELAQGRHANAIRTHRDYFADSRELFRYHRMKRLKLPKGSGAMESAIRRVVNLRIKGASIYWLEASIEAILILRSFYKSKRWATLHRMAVSPEALLQ